MYKRILFPTDGSPFARTAATSAVALARACGSEILALSVARPTYLMPSDESAMTSDPDFRVDTLMNAADAHVQQVAQAAFAAGVPCTTLTIFSDFPSVEILEVAEREQCDLIVMSSHGRRGLRRLLAARETESVVDGSPVPVLVLPPAAKDHD